MCICYYVSYIKEIYGDISDVNAEAVTNIHFRCWLFADVCTVQPCLQPCYEFYLDLFYALVGLFLVKYFKENKILYHTY
jgi:hypothetical protein